MSAEQKRTARWWPGALLVVCGLAVAGESNAPEAAFIEYLGMWDESDDEWLMFEEEDNLPSSTGKQNEERSDPVPEGEVSTENDDEL